MAEKTVQSYIDKCPPEVQAILKELRVLVTGTLDATTERMRYGAPVYFNRNGVEVIYLYGGRDHANLGFMRGALLDDPDGLLSGTGKIGRHIKIFPKKEFDVSKISRLIQQCDDQT